MLVNYEHERKEKRFTICLYIYVVSLRFLSFSCDFSCASLPYDLASTLSLIAASSFELSTDKFLKNALCLKRTIVFAAYSS